MIAASTDISAIPAEFVKYFVMMCMAGAGMWFAHKRGKQASGTKADPLSIAQPLDVRTVPEHAIKGDTQHELLRLNQKIEATTRENLRQHEATAKRMDDVLKSGDDRAVKILSALNDMEARMTAATLREIKDIHIRLNPVAEAVNGHGEAIKRIDSRCAELWTWICKIFDLIPLPKKAK